ncbi:MAG: hypothetical protein J1D85_04870 [Bacteroidales bacterium]|nr:hypothetical protein [Bacteroidales bacterium]
MDFLKDELTAVRERINRLLKERGITQNAVAAGNAPAQKRINSQLSHGASLSVDTLLRVLAACPDVSADWLLKGATNNSLNTESSRTIYKVQSQEDQRVLSEPFVKELLDKKDKQIQLLMELLKCK